VGWAVLWAVNDALPYVGLRDDSCQTMFSSLEWGVGPDGRSWNNHLVVPQHMVSSLWSYLEVREVRITGEARDARERALVRWLSREGYALHVEAVRVVVSQLCEHHTISLEVRTRVAVPSGGWGPAGPLEQAPFERIEDACAEPDLSEPHVLIPVRLFETDYPL